MFPGDSKVDCGGEGLLQAFYKPTVKAQAPSSTDKSYVGCHVDGTVTGTRNPDWTDIDGCRTYCGDNKKKYFGVSNSRYCFCSDELKQESWESRVPEAECKRGERWISHLLTCSDTISLFRHCQVSTERSASVRWESRRLHLPECILGVSACGMSYQNIRSNTDTRLIRSAVTGKSRFQFQKQLHRFQRFRPRLLFRLAPRSRLLRQSGQPSPEPPALSPPPMRQLPLQRSLGASWMEGMPMHSPQPKQ